MTNSNKNLPASSVIDVPQNTSAKAAVIRGSVQLQDKIRERAYELYESRGCQSGQHNQDWLLAEEEILSQK